MTAGNAGTDPLAQFPVPDGWFVFGTHVDDPVRLEFSEQVGDDGLPLWERPAADDPVAGVTDLLARRQDAAAVPAPGEPEITMFMDADRIIFRDQRALDAYVAAAVLGLDDNDTNVSAVADAICVEVSGEHDYYGAWTDEARAALAAIAGLLGGEEE